MGSARHKNIREMEMRGMNLGHTLSGNRALVQRGDRRGWLGVSSNYIGTKRAWKKVQWDCVGKGLAVVKVEADSLGYAFIIT